MKYILSSILLSSLLFSCTKPEETETPNMNPSRFTLNILSTGANHISAKWEPSNDPEGEYVLYDVYLNNQIYAQNTVLTDMFFFPLNPESEYAIRIEAKDVSGQKTVKELYAYTEKNNAPNNFTISTNFVEKDKAEIVWSAATDVDGTQTMYNIYLNGELAADGITATNFLFENLTPLTSYSGTIIAFDGYGGESAANFAFTTLSE